MGDMKSQYLEPYKQHYLSRAAEGIKPVAVGTFINYNLQGRAKRWSNRYRKSLINSLTKDGWVPCKSINGSIAYGPPVI